MSNDERGDHYQHRFHAGNIGDVWKHLTTLAIIEELAGSPRPLVVCDCHGGEGLYQLGPTGEWSEGIGRLAMRGRAEGPALLARYLDLVDEAGFSTSRTYPGSPWLLSRALRRHDSLVVCEIDRPTFETLRSRDYGQLAPDFRNEDGVAALVALAARHTPDAHLFGVMDPPWSEKSDWTTFPLRLCELSKRRPAASFLLWYPIKSYTRINAMLNRLKEMGLPYVAIDLITTPLEYQRNRLNGSGMVLVNAPARAVARISECAVVLGERCKTAKNHWRFGILANGDALV